MKEYEEIDRYVNEPILLVILCREVIDRLDNDNDVEDLASLKIQLREISYAVNSLEKQGVPVPEALRGEKIRLSVILTTFEKNNLLVNDFAKEMRLFLDDIDSRFSFDTDDQGGNTPKKRRSRSPKTQPDTLRNLIITGLQKYGGSASKANIVEYVGTQLEGKLLPKDLEWREATNEYTWQNNVGWERNRMIQDGIMKSDTPHGIWELTENQK